MYTAWKVSKYGVFYWSVFSFIRTEYRKIRTRKKTPYLVTFYAVVKYRNLQFKIFVKKLLIRCLTGFWVSLYLPYTSNGLLVLAPRKKCPYLEFSWSAFSRNRTKKTPNTDTFYKVLGLPVLKILDAYVYIQEDILKAMLHHHFFTTFILYYPL